MNLHEGLNRVSERGTIYQETRNWSHLHGDLRLSLLNVIIFHIYYI